MKIVRRLVVTSVLSLFGAFCWVGCTDDENPNSAKDGGGGGGGGNRDVVTQDVQTLDVTLGDTGRPIQLNVADYCAVMAQSCPGQYPSPAACTAAGNRMVLGTVTDTNVNTLGCRLLAAVQGRCPVASASGGGVCGSRCEGFCRLASNDTPLGFCRKLVIDAGVDANDGGGGLDAAADADPDAEGGAVADGGGADGGVDGGGVVDAGPQYTEPYANNAACLAACSGFQVETSNEQYGQSGPTNNFNCRLYHLLNGMGLGQGQAGKTHCDHIGVTSPMCNQ